MQRLFVIFLFLFLFISCEEGPEVVFLEPQPVNSSDESSFPKKLLGKYLNPEDSSILILENKLILARREYSIRISRFDIDSASGINRNDNKAILQGLKKDGIEARVEGDSIFGIWTAQDTVFVLSNGNKLRKMNGAYFLNTQIREGAYKVLRLKPEGNKYLKFSVIVPGDSLYKYEAITDIKKVMDDSGRVSEYNLKPSRKELKKLLREDLYIETEDVYMKIKD